MALRPKRKYTSVPEHDALLEAFYQNLDQEDEDFLKNKFIEADKDNFSPVGSDSDGGNDKPAVVEEPACRSNLLKVFC